MDRRIKNPKDSHVYSIGYFGFHTTLKGSDVYRNGYFGFHTTLKGSDVYRNGRSCFYTTPKGSNPLRHAIFYKHQIPSGLFMETIEADFQKELAE